MEKSSQKTLKNEEEELRNLWQKYKTQKKERLRDQLVLYYAPVVKYVAGRLKSKLPQTVDLSDLISYGILGLIDAIEKFDLTRNVKFETYALARIKGAILDELRRLDWVPRSVRERAKKLETVYQELLGNLKRTPTDKEIANKLKISPHKLNDLLNKLSYAQLLTLDEVWGSGPESEEGLSLIEVIEDAKAEEPLTLLELEERKRVLVEIVKTLPEREKEIVVLYYYEGLNFKEIAEILDLTESRISQLHTKALLYLKSILKGARLP